MIDSDRAINAEKNKTMMAKHGVLSWVEMESRAEIQYEIYIKTINIEGLTAVEISKRQLLPAIINFKADLASSIASIEAVGGDVSVEKELFGKVNKAMKSFNANIANLEKALEKAANLHGDSKTQAEAYRDLVFTAMNELRIDADVLETLVDADYWPLPTYSDLLFKV